MTDKDDDDEIQKNLDTLRGGIEALLPDEVHFSPHGRRGEKYRGDDLDYSQEQI